MHIAETRKKRTTAADWDDMLVAPVEPGTAPAWAALVPGNGYKYLLSVRADESIEAAVQEVRETVPGLSESAAVRLLLAVGIDGLRAVATYAPGVVDDAVRTGEPVPLSACRLAAMVCPLVSNSVRYTAGV